MESCRREMAKTLQWEIDKIGILRAEDVVDFHVVHVPKTYPAYFGSYDRFDVIRNSRTSSKIYFWWAVTACTSTTIKTIPCSRPRPPLRTSSTVVTRKRTSGPSILKWTTTRKRPQSRDRSVGSIPDQPSRSHHAQGSIMLCHAKLMICLQIKQMANTPGLAYPHVKLTS